jgi:TPP-dependent pyruvate/acetoin dehydrogenase alpha subunit
VADRAPYRSDEEVAAWRARDPVARLRAHLLERGMLAADEDEALRRSAAERADAAMAAAVADPDPGPEVLGLDTVFARSAA